MTLSYNIESAKEDIIFKQNDTIDFSYLVYLNDVLFDMTGIQMDIMFKRKDGLLVKKLSTVTGEIIITTSMYSCYTTGFLDANVLDYEVQLTDGTQIMTIQEGSAYSRKEITK